MSRATFEIGREPRKPDHCRDPLRQVPVNVATQPDPDAVEAARRYVASLQRRMSERAARASEAV